MPSGWPHSYSKASRQFCQLAMLTAAGAIGAGSQAQAALFYWTESNPGYYRPEPMTPPRRQPPRSRQWKQTVIPQKEAKPKGPVIIAISIEKQEMKVYDANGFFASAPVSTGMPGHPTPTGVFSVIQKHKFHHSNIYSDAPMPYMQRITWSGVAMHAGVLPGYPASHGCIRMPMAFSIKMWNWTKMGARVVVTPGEITPVAFSHPLLTAMMAAPRAAAIAGEPFEDAPAGAKADKGVFNKPARLQASFELRPSIGRSGIEAPTTIGNGIQGKSAVSSEAETALPGATTANLPVTSIEDATKIANETSATRDSAAGAPNTVQLSVAPPARLIPVTDAASDVRKDQARVADADKMTTGIPEARKRVGQISAFISRKDSRLYVRQNFAPLFDVPVRIAPSDLPLGTHVFTAEAEKNDAAVLHWSVVSLPARLRHARHAIDDERALRSRLLVDASADSKPAPNGPAEALDRVAIPADATARLGEVLTTGSSIIVSDQGINQGETGEGTDFIVSLH
jgi:lipoprotein-anchoring transpeptidase ErfK/SrfK